MKRRLLPHALALWISAPLLLLIATQRPGGGDRARAAALPRVLRSFAVVTDYPITPAMVAALGTTDAIQRRYRSALGDVFLIAVFHEANWKSVHAPDTCLRGGGMDVVEDDHRRIASGETTFEVGRLLMRKNKSGEEYLSLFCYVAPPAFVTGSYWQFFLHHAPRALFRQDLSGCLLRAETFVDAGGVAAAEQRCAELLSELVPLALDSLR
jgi:EpsI family protein